MTTTSKTRLSLHLIELQGAEGNRSDWPMSNGLGCGLSCHHGWVNVGSMSAGSSHMVVPCQTNQPTKIEIEHMETCLLYAPLWLARCCGEVDCCIWNTMAVDRVNKSSVRWQKSLVFATTFNSIPKTRAALVNLPYRDYWCRISIRSLDWKGFKSMTTGARQRVATDRPSSQNVEFYAPSWFISSNKDSARSLTLYRFLFSNIYTIGS